VAVVELSEDPGGALLRVAAGLLPGQRRSRTLPDRELVRRRVPVDRAHLAAYDRVCGFRLTDALPATYPHVLAFPLAMRLMATADFPFPVVGLIHVANRITLHRPIDAAEQLDLSVQAADLRDHARGRQFDVLATATTGGEEVWRGVSTYLRKERESDRRDHRDQPDEPAQAATTARWRVGTETGREYAAVSGDRNPIHTSRLGARLFGFPRPIAHGMWSKARSLAALEGRLPGRYTVDVAFQAPILLPATVSFRAAETGDGWEFGVVGKRPHLAGQVTHP
jgi:acyl dehydratase